MNLLVGLALLPTSAAALFAAAGLFKPLFAQTSVSAWFLGGFLAYPVFHWAALRPSRLYVFGHELTHALAAVLSGEQVKKFEVGKEGGHVEVSAVSPFIALAPYCVPLYTLLWIGAWRLFTVLGPGARYHSVFLAGIGLSLSFHLCYTLSALVGQKQPDLAKAGGVVFSLSLIALANAAAVAVTLRGLFPHLVSLKAFFAASWIGTKTFWLHGARLTAGTFKRLTAPAAARPS